MKRCKRKHSCRIENRRNKWNVLGWKITEEADAELHPYISKHQIYNEIIHTMLFERDEDSDAERGVTDQDLYFAMLVNIQ